MRIFEVSVIVPWIPFVLCSVENLLALQYREAGCFTLFPLQLLLQNLSVVILDLVHQLVELFVLCVACLLNAHFAANLTFGMANCPALLCLAFQRYLLLVVCSWPMLPQLPCRWAHCLAEATVICSTEFASSNSLYRLCIFQLSRFFSRYRLPRCVLLACILILAEWNAQYFNVIIHFPLKFVLFEFVNFLAEILHLKFIIKLLTHFSSQQRWSGINSRHFK